MPKWDRKDWRMGYKTFEKVFFYSTKWRKVKADFKILDI